MRPFLARTATLCGLSGWCRNGPHGVTLQWQGSEKTVLRAESLLLTDAPPLARVHIARRTVMPDVPEDSGFIIRESARSEAHAASEALIPPDVAMCEDCAAELTDPANRRYRYPFITCTQCGPRLSIIRELPYDRPGTTMAHFPLCPECAAEYHDPLSRRYHAQPISCPHCGPRLWVEPEGSHPQEVWDNGGIVAVKGIGGFHLLCDARDAQAVRGLRRRKHRPNKPLAVMVPTLEDAHTLVHLSDEMADLLVSPAHPIVIAPSRHRLPEEVAPGIDSVGVMLPYSPLHALLVDRPLVATSGNRSGEPVCFTEDQAREVLDADCFVMHDRGIHTPVEDSVFRGTLPVRRSRGIAPAPVPLPSAAANGPMTLAVGGELKNTFALAIDESAHLSAHIGDMESAATQAAFGRAVRLLTSLRGADPALVACDSHPDYATTAWAERYAERHHTAVVDIQHHYAHACALLGEHGGCDGAVACLDGTGYGTDGTIWGGEVLRVHGARWQRVWHLPVFSLPGGDLAAREPWRCALGLAEALGCALTEGFLQRRFGAVPEEALIAATWQLRTGMCTRTSSAGRLLDAAAALIGVAPLQQTYEGHAASLLEAMAARSSIPDSGIPFSDVLRGLVTGAMQRSGLSAADQARLVHLALGREVAQALVATDEPIVGMSGGCAVNHVLVTAVRGNLGGRELLTHHRVPPNDGGLSYGQAVAARLAWQEAGGS